jgi:hypothetical protein
VLPGYVCLKIDVTESCNELLRDGRMPIYGREVERRAPILLLKIEVTSSCNELFRDGSHGSPPEDSVTAVTPFSAEKGPPVDPAGV